MEIWNNTQKDLPNATTILVLGILSLVLFWFWGGFVSLVLGIVTWAMANNQRRTYMQFPGEYTDASFQNVNTGRICAIIAVCLAAFMLVFVILVFMGVMVGIGSGIFSSAFL